MTNTVEERVERRAIHRSIPGLNVTACMDRNTRPEDRRPFALRHEVTCAECNRRMAPALI